MSVRRQILLAFILYQIPIDVQEAVAAPLDSMTKEDSEVWLTECMKVVKSGSSPGEMVNRINNISIWQL